MSRQNLRPMLDVLEARRLFAGVTPIAINFNDEALWSDNFAAAAKQAKALGVQSVRLWFGFTGYDSRPNAWDPVSPFGAVTAGEIPADEAHTDGLPTVMTRAFQLKRMGFNVLAVVQPNDTEAPESSAAAKGFIRHLMDATETPNGTQTLKDVVDAWEIGNEVDSPTYWKPSAANKVAGLKNYVDSWLIPASEELHSGPRDQWEKVVSAGVSYNPNDLKTILDELVAQGAKSAIDYAGFHPYGVWTSTNHEITANSVKAKQFADAFGTKLIATEWNIRGLGNAGANTAAWAVAMDQAYREAILPNFDTAYYFALVNNWAARGGATSARPGGLLKHNTTATVTTTSPVLDLRAYYKSSLSPAEPFYSTFSNWQYGSVSGTVNSQVPAGTGATAVPVSVYIDVNKNGWQDGSEPRVMTDTDGAYKITYSVRDVLPGTYAVRLSLPSSVKVIVGGVNIALTNTKHYAAPLSVIAPPGPLSSISGYLWNDGNGDGLLNKADSYTGGRVVFIDANGNGQLDVGEKQTTANANGNYTFANLTPGNYKISRVFPDGYRMSNSATGYLSVTTTAGQMLTGANIGTTIAQTVPPADGHGTVGAGTASISGKMFAQIAKWNSAVASTAWKVFLDTDKDGIRDANERYATAGSDGVYTLSGLAGGSYTLALESVSGWNIVSPSAKSFTFTLKAGQAKTGQNFVVAHV
ncbi:MAG: Cna domain protein [Phycisphaerales bacterium]|nr:Cna domain protein [Phycisphaerales bacterium]